MSSNDQVTISYRTLTGDRDFRYTPMKGAMEVLEKAFPHGGRDIDAFAATVARNHNAAIQQRFHNAQYNISLATFHGHKRKRVIGVSAYMILPSPEGTLWDNKYDVVVFGDFRAVLPAFQGGGIANGLRSEAFVASQRHMKHLGRNRHDRDLRQFRLQEVALPHLMPVSHYIQDIEMAYIDPCDRLNVWGNAGNRRLLPSADVPIYVEPASDTGGEECIYYALNGELAGHQSIMGSTLASILEIWTAFRLNSGLPCESKIFKDMIYNLNHAGPIQPVDDREWVPKLKSSIGEVFSRVGMPNLRGMPHSVGRLLSQHGHVSPQII